MWRMTFIKKGFVFLEEGTSLEAQEHICVFWNDSKNK